MLSRDFQTLDEQIPSRLCGSVCTIFSRIITVKGGTQPASHSTSSVGPEQNPGTSNNRNEIAPPPLDGKLPQGYRCRNEEAYQACARRCQENRRNHHNHRQHPDNFQKSISSCEKEDQA